MHSFEAIKSEPPHYQEVLFYYKINPCPTLQPQKSHKNHSSDAKCPQIPCYNYHNLQERRRPVFDNDTRNLLYEPRLCPRVNENAKCEEEDDCRYSHSLNEIYYHPLYYKTEPCKSCQNPEIPKLCPQYHADEANRTLLLEKFKMKESQPSNGFQGQRGFSLDTFKVKPCTIKGNHNPKVCDYYHFEKDRRRPPSVYTYSTTMCQYARKDLQCPNGDKCGYCHNKVEELYHPDRYKRKFCLCHPHNIHKCEYGDYCSFAHSEEEIKIELLHNIKKDEQFYMYKYKTVFCPYIYSHDRNQCVYAHNPQDYRRDPKTHQYNPVQCKNWSQGQIYSYEEGSCPKLMNCECCHGWKELEYHPLYYKTKNCSNFKNCNKADCPFLHQEKDAKTPTAGAGGVNQPRNLSMGTSRDFGFASPNRPTTYHHYKDDSRSNFYTQFKVKSDRKKDNYRKDNNSHFPGPIMPPQQNYSRRIESQGGGQSQGQDESQNQYQQRPYKMEGSTRPNSNASASTLYHEDAPKKQNKKKKKKQMSLNDKKDETTKSPLSQGGGSEVATTKGTKMMSSPQGVNWSFVPSSEEKTEGQQSGGKRGLGKFSATKTNDSFESLQSYTIEKFETPTADKTGKSNNANEQFRKGLVNALQKRGLDYTIPILMSPGVDIEGLKAFNHREFGLYPQIKAEDKEKIVPIIRKLLDEEVASTIINPFQSQSQFEMLLGLGAAESSWGGANLDFLDSNSNLDFTKHPF